MAYNERGTFQRDLLDALVVLLHLLHHFGYPRSQLATYVSLEFACLQKCALVALTGMVVIDKNILLLLY